MRTLDMNELKEIQGGFNAAVALVGAAIVVFLAGVFEGIVHPKKCD